MTSEPEEDFSEHDFLGDVFGDAINESGFQVEGYELLGEIDRGGMGSVYHARQDNPDREVALKVMLPQLAFDKQMRARFFREIKAMASLDHPGILPIYEVGEADKMPFFSMKLALGGSLADRLQTYPEGFELPEVVEMIREIAMALHHAHQKGVLHRDIKPANLLFGARGRIYVSDFGVAKLEDQSLMSLTQTQNFVGTPDYIPPELVEDPSNSTIAGDIFSLGAVFYECLTGKKIYGESKSLASHLRTVTQDPVTPPSRIAEKIPKDLETICLKALDRNPGKRYSSAEEFANDLARWQQGLAVLARPLNLGQRAIRYIRRNALVSAATAIVLLILLIAGAILLNQRFEAQKADRMRVFSSMIEQARAERYLGKQGFRPKALKLLQDADAIADSPKILDEGIAVLNKPDLITTTRPLEEGAATISQELVPPSGDSRMRVELRWPGGELRAEPSGRLLMYPAGQEQPCRIWNPVAGGRIIAEYLPHRDALIIAGSENELALYSADNGELLRTLSIDKGDYEVRSYDEREFSPLVQLSFFSLAPSGRKLALGGGFGVGVLDIETLSWSWWKRRGQLRFPPAWSEKEDLLAVALGEEKGVLVIDAEDGQASRAFETTGWAESVVLQRDGDYLAVACDDGLVYVFDLYQSQPLARLRLNAVSLRCCTEEDFLEITLRDGTRSYWDYRRPIGFHYWTGAISSITNLTFFNASLSPDGRWLLLVYNECLQVYSVEERKRTGFYATNHQRIDSTAGAWWLPDEEGAILLQVPGAWDVLRVSDEGKIVFEGPSDRRLPGARIVKIEPTGDWLVDVLDEDGVTQREIWQDGDANRARPAERLEESEVRGLQNLSRSSRYRAEILRDGLIRVTTQANERFHLTPPEKTPIKFILFLPDGERLFCASYDNQLFEWDLAELRRELPRFGFAWPE